MSALRYVSSCFAVITLAQQPLGPATIIEHVTLIDPTGSPARRDMSVLIAGDRIARIEPSTRMRPSGAITIDVSGKFLIPGLWDMHVHALSKNRPDDCFPLFIANGVTGIRDMGGDLPLTQIAQLKSDVASGTRVGPQIFAAGPIREDEHPFWPFSIPVKNPEDGQRAVRTLLQSKADFIKVYNTLTRDEYLAIAAQAKQSRLPLVCHIFA